MKSDCGSTRDCKAVDKSVAQRLKDEMVQQVVNDFAVIEHEIFEEEQDEIDDEMDEVEGDMNQEDFNQVEMNQENENQQD